MATPIDIFGNGIKFVSDTLNSVGLSTDGADTGIRGGQGDYGLNDSYWGNDSYPLGNGYGYGYGGGGGGGGGKSAEDVQKETQAQINNTAGNYKNRGADLSKLGAQNLRNKQKSIDQNLALYKQSKNQAMKQVEWQPNQQKEQSTKSALRNRMGNAAYGSGLVDLMEGMARVDDMNDVNTINAWKQTFDQLFSNFFQGDEDLKSDYADQVTSIQDEFSKLFSQYWSTMSNINPLLATEEHLKKSANGEEVTVGEGTDAYTLPAGIKLEASDELKALMKDPERISAVNPDTHDYVRPDRAVNAARDVLNTGSANRASAANRGYLDNLDVYRRRV